jgi:hypothetical protein
MKVGEESLFIKRSQPTLPPHTKEGHFGLGSYMRVFLGHITLLKINSNLYRTIIFIFLISVNNVCFLYSSETIIVLM